MSKHLDGLWKVIKTSPNYSPIILDNTKTHDIVLEGSGFFYYFYFNFILYEREHCETSLLSGFDLFFSNLKRYHLNLKAVVFSLALTTQGFDTTHSYFKKLVSIIKNDYNNWYSIKRFAKPSITREVFVQLLQHYLKQKQPDVLVLNSIQDYDRFLASYAYKNDCYVMTNTNNFLFYNLKGVIRMSECKYLFQVNPDSSQITYTIPEVYSYQGLMDSLHIPIEKLRLLGVLNDASCVSLHEIIPCASVHKLLKIINEHGDDYLTIVETLKEIKSKHYNSRFNSMFPMRESEELVSLIKEAEKTFILPYEADSFPSYPYTIYSDIYQNQITKEAFNQQLKNYYENQQNKSIQTILDDYINVRNNFPLSIIFKGFIYLPLCHVPTRVSQETVLRYAASKFETVLRTHYINGFKRYNYYTTSKEDFITIENAKELPFGNLEAFMSLYEKSWNEKFELLCKCLGMNNVFKNKQTLYQNISPAIPVALFLLKDYYDHQNELKRTCGIIYKEYMDDLHTILESSDDPLITELASLSSEEPQENQSNSPYVPYLAKSYKYLTNKLKQTYHLRNELLDTQFEYEKIKDNQLDPWILECIAYTSFMYHRHTLFTPTTAYQKDRKYYMAMILETYLFFLKCSTDLLALFGIIQPYSQEFCSEAFLNVYLNLQNPNLSYTPHSEEMDFQNWYTGLGYEYKNISLSKSENPDYVKYSHQLQLAYCFYPKLVHEKQKKQTHHSGNKSPSSTHPNITRSNITNYRGRGNNRNIPTRRPRGRSLRTRGGRPLHISRRRNSQEDHPSYLESPEEYDAILNGNMNFENSESEDTYDLYNNESYSSYSDMESDMSDISGYEDYGSDDNSDDYDESQSYMYQIQSLD